MPTIYQSAVASLRRLCLPATVAALSVALSGCVTVRSEYPEIRYYRLADSRPLDPLLKNTYDLSVWLRPIEAELSVDKPQMSRRSAESQLERMFYDRWAAPPPELIGEVFRHRWMRYGVFRQGLVRNASAVIPDVIIEARLADFTFSQPETRGDTLRAHVSMAVTLIRNDKDSTGPVVLLSKLYEHTEVVAFTKPDDYSRAMSEAVAIIADEIIIDLGTYLNVR